MALYVYECILAFMQHLLAHVQTVRPSALVFKHSKCIYLYMCTYLCVESDIRVKCFHVSIKMCLHSYTA